MLYHTNPAVEQFGLVRFRNWKVLELDASSTDQVPTGPGLVAPPRAGFEKALSRMAIVVPIRNERIKFLEGVLAGIPRGVQTIVVSNSDRTPVDRFRVEREALTAFAQATGRRVRLIHQRDESLAKALGAAGYDGLLDRKGLVENGKGQSMSVGVMAALATGSEYVGFIDSDNYVPGAVLEHVWNYASGFSSLGSERVCVREVWNFKPKVRDSLRFNRLGRVSRITNRYLNHLIAAHTGFETDDVRTGNAGEHAMTATLAREMPLASGFAVETWELRWILEQWGGVSELSQLRGDGVDVLQVETRNPHFHEDKGDGHIVDMVAASLGTLYHSPLATPEFRKDVVHELARHGWRRKPPAPKILPAPNDGDLRTFAAWIAEAEPELLVGPPFVR